MDLADFIPVLSVHLCKLKMISRNYNMFYLTSYRILHANWLNPVTWKSEMRQYPATIFNFYTHLI